MKLDNLYTLDSRGKIRVFECESLEIEGRQENKVITRTGLLNGKLIQQIELIQKGKQNRSVKEQAEFQTKSLWNEKLDEGYKSKELLEAKAFLRCLIDENQVIPEGEAGIHWLLTKIPDASYTNSFWDELPMLAHKFKDIKNPEFPYYAQPKLNGVRALIKFDINKGIKLCSRGGTYYKIPHLEHSLIELFNQLPNTAIALDGEIYKHGIPLQDISGAARKEDNSMFASNNWLEYWIYDVVNLTGELSQKGRLLNLNTVANIIGKNNPHIKIVETFEIGDKDAVTMLHDRFVSEGYEGLILRKPDGLYEFNQRSKNLLKVKQYQDAEFIIKGSAMQISEPESFVFILGNDINNEVFKARPTGTLAQKEEWHRNIDNYIGKKATVRYFERSKEGLPLQGSVQHKLTEVLIEHLRPNGE